MTRTFRLDDARVDLDRLEIRRGEEAVPLTPLEASLLAHLASRRGQTVSREELLHEVWGYAEGVQTQAVRACVRRLRQKLEPDPDEPRWLKTVRGVGWMLEGAGTVAMPTATPAPTHTGSRVGRDAELEALQDALAAPDPVVLLGPAGVGKTRLACEVARAWPGELAFADLTDCADLPEARATVARALGLAPEVSSDRIGAALAGRPRPLVVLDNLESVLPLIAEVPAWLRAAPEARVLATSQDRPGLPGEPVVELSGLPAHEATALFCDRAGVEPSARVERVVRCLDGLPLAIELVAARTRVLDLEQLAERLERRVLPVARGRAVGAPARHQSLTAALDAAWERLDPPARAALAQLSVFRRSLSIQGAEAVVDAGGVDALDLVHELRDRSLLRRISEPHGWTLQLTRAVREYAGRRLAERDDAASAAARHASFVLREARDRAPRILSAAHRANLWAVHERFADDARGLWALVWLSLPSHSRRTSRVLDAFARVDDAVGLPPRSSAVTDPLLVASLEIHRLEVRRQAGRAGADPVVPARVAVTRCEATGDLSLRLRAIAHLARTLSDQGDHRGALEQLERAMDMARAHPRPVWSAKLQIVHSTVLQNIGSADAILRSARRAQELAERAQLHAERWKGVMNEAHALRQLGDASGARERMLSLLTEIPPGHRGELTARVMLGALCADLGDPEAALCHQRRALEVQAPWGEAWPRRLLLPNMAVNHLLLDQLDAADAALAAAPPAGPSVDFQVGRVIIEALLAWGRAPDDTVAERLEAIRQGSRARVEHAHALAACVRALAGQSHPLPELTDPTSRALAELVPACVAAAAGDLVAARAAIDAVGCRAGTSGHVVVRQIRRRSRS